MALSINARVAVATKPGVELRGRRMLCVRVAAAAAPARGTTDADADALPSATRRAIVLAVPLVPFIAGVVKPRRASAFVQDAVDSQGEKLFLGYNQQPDLYMGYGAASAQAKYSFKYPATWVTREVSKTEKSTMGMDGRVDDPDSPKTFAYVLALGGKDYADSVLKDARSSLIAVAGGDPDLRQAMTDGTVETGTKKVAGVEGGVVYTADVASDRKRFLATVAKKGDTVFALVVASPARTFGRDEAELRRIQETFTLL